MRKDAKLRKEDKETKEWIKNKYDNAKFLIQALSQRRATMLKVMTAIVGRQKDFFYYGPSALKPLIYKDISEDTRLDIATICRIVNNKFVQTQFGTFELKYFFSESLPSENGEEISTKVIKQVIKEIINNEPKDKPYSDEKIVEELRKLGYIVARRTVAKYREQMRIPVARLRKEL
jgi:RNA polymerase sigma-54 factor